MHKQLTYSIKEESSICVSQRLLSKLILQLGRCVAWTKQKNDQHFIEKNKSKLVYWISQQDHQSVGQGLAKKEKKIGKMLEKR